MAISDLRLTKSHAILLKLLAKANGTKTLEELTPDYAKAMGKDFAKKSSLTTAVSQLRTEFKEANVAFPKECEYKKETGGGRSSERESITDILGEIGVEFELKEVAPKKVVTPSV